MNSKAATAPIDVAPDPVLASDALFVVGITSEGGVPLLVDSRPDDDADRFAEGLKAGRPQGVVHQASCKASCGCPGSSGPDHSIRFPRCIAACKARRASTPRSSSSCPATAFRRVREGARRSCWPPTPECRRPPRGTPPCESSRSRSFRAGSPDRRAEGLRIDPRVWIGLLLAERHFPRWAEARLRAAVEELHRRRPVPAGEAQA